MSGQKPPPRYPLQPLVDYLTQTGAHDADDWFIDLDTKETRLSNNRVGDLCNVAGGSISRWRQSGIPEDSAEQVALHLGLVPSMLWPDEYNSYEIDELMTVPQRRRKQARAILSQGGSIEHLYSTLERPVPAGSGQRRRLASTNPHR